MGLQLHAPLLIACLTLMSACAMATPAPNEDNCRMAIAQGLDMLRRAPPGRTPRDEADRQRLLADMQRLVEENRRQGVAECRTWNQMMGRAFNQ